MLRNNIVAGKVTRLFALIVLLAAFATLSPAGQAKADCPTCPHIIVSTGN